jgi:hypothetical protein
MRTSIKSNNRVINKLQITAIGNESFIPVEKREDMNWIAKQYRERSNSLYTGSAAVDMTDCAVTFRGTKSEHNNAVAAAAKVRHNGRQPSWTPGKYVMIGGVPHKVVDGNLVPLSNPVQDKLAAEINKQLHKLAGLKIVK